LYVTPFEYLSEKRVKEWKENKKHEERSKVEGQLEQ
jgi:hypothetical protein